MSDGVSTLSQSEQRQWRLQKERLHNDFTKALNSFQAAQRTAAQKEKEAIKAAKKPGMGGIAGKNIYNQGEFMRNGLDFAKKKKIQNVCSIIAKLG